VTSRPAAAAHAGTLAAVTTVAEIGALLARWYPPAWADDWDRVGLVLGDPHAAVDTVLCAVDCLPEVVDEAERVGAQLLVVHHPLLLRGVSSVAPTTYKGRIVHRMIRAGIALFTAHTNADVAAPGVSDALAARLGLVDLRPLRPLTRPPAHLDGAAPNEAASQPGAAQVGVAGDGAGAPGNGRIGRLPRPLSLRAFTEHAAAVLPETRWGVRAAGDPERTIEQVAVCGGAGDTYLRDAVAAGVDAYLTADLRHHPVSEHLAEGGPALLDAGHWATERPWLDDRARRPRAGGLLVHVSDVPTDPWSLHAAAPTDELCASPEKPAPSEEKEPRP
jgi:dinuclear metal center YbgI/SA1388 family protein